MSNRDRQILRFLARNRSRVDQAVSKRRADPFSAPVGSFYRFNKDHVTKLGIERLIVKTSRGRATEYYDLMASGGHIPQPINQLQGVGNYKEISSRSFSISRTGGDSRGLKAQVIAYCQDPDSDDDDGIRELCNYLLHDFISRYTELSLNMIDKGYNDLERIYQRSRSEEMLPGTLAISIVRILAAATSARACIFAVARGEAVYLEYSCAARPGHRRSDHVYGGSRFEASGREITRRRAGGASEDYLSLPAGSGLGKNLLSFLGYADSTSAEFAVVPLEYDGEEIAWFIFWWGDAVFGMSNAVHSLVARAARYLAPSARYLYQRRVKQLIVDPIFRGRETRVKEKSCFVVMPFGLSWSEDVYGVIKDVMESSGYVPTRADEMFGENIVEDIWSAILSAEVIVADVTGKNPNVFYELGIAHTVGKRILLLTQDVNDIPFDTRHLRHVVYSNDIGGFKDIRAGVTGLLKRG